MRCIIRVLLSVAFLLATANRLPAPIQETPESPTPTPAPQPQASLPPSPTPPLTPSRFAGTWTGKIKFGKAGEVEFTFVVNPEVTMLQQKSTNFGNFTHPVVVTGQSLSWQGGGIARDVVWTLTPNINGQTALVTHTGVNGMISRAVFQHAQLSDEVTPSPTQQVPAKKRHRP